jgi:hypothetical protein
LTVAPLLMVTQLFEPLNESADPNLPAGLHVAPLIAPVLPFPDVSPAVLPDDSSKL